MRRMRVLVEALLAGWFGSAGPLTAGGDHLHYVLWDGAAIRVPSDW